MTDFTIGELTAIFNIILFLMQIVILKSDLPKSQFLQLPVGILFGYMIDFNLIILQNYLPGTYIEQWLLCLASFILLGVWGYSARLKQMSLCSPVRGL